MPLEGLDAPPARPPHRSQQHVHLVADYQSGAGSTYVLAWKYKVDRHTISAALKGQGVAPGQTSMSDFEVERALELLARGTSWNTIGKELGRDPKTVKTTCRKSSRNES